MANSAITLSGDTRVKWGMDSMRTARKLTIDWTADDTDASVPKLTLSGVGGYVLKMVTNPGSTAPTDNYDVTLEGSADTTVDHLAGAGSNRDTANTEVAYPSASSAPTPVWLDPDESYKVAVAGNAVNSATGQIILYLVDSL